MKFDTIGYWSEIKLEIIREYAQAYSQILTRHPLHHVYIDAFAGSGLHLSKTKGEFVKGSPLNALAAQGVRHVQVVANVAVEASGRSHSVPALCAGLARLGHDVRLHTVEPAPAAWPYAGVVHTPHRRSLPRIPLRASAGLHAALRREAQSAAVLHSHGLWLLPNVYPARVVRGTRCRLVTSPRGTLAPVALGISRWSKKLMWAVVQRAAVEASDCLHATSLTEREEILAAGLRRPIAVIPNGVSIPEAKPAAETTGRELRRLLFLGRIHPIKGLDVLVPVWRELESAFPDWQLVIAGPDEGSHRDALRELARAAGCRRIEFHPPAYGAAKSALLWSADLFVLPTRTENFGMAVAEALAHGVPVVTTHGAPWSGLETHGAGWWVQLDRDALGQALRDAMSLAPDALARRGVAGRAWMQRAFSWDEIAREMQAVYFWLAGDGPQPASVSPP
jgi:glycosyltransferase involved in cell wall biosynthesis